MRKLINICVLILSNFEIKDYVLLQVLIVCERIIVCCSRDALQGIVAASAYTVN